MNFQTLNRVVDKIKKQIISASTCPYLVFATQVKPGQGGTTQSIKTSAQAIQLQQIPQSGTIQATLPQQILLRPTTQSATGQPHFQGIIKKIRFFNKFKRQLSFFCFVFLLHFVVVALFCLFIGVLVLQFGWFALFFPYYEIINYSSCSKCVSYVPDCVSLMIQYLTP